MWYNKDIPRRDSALSVNNPTPYETRGGVEICLSCSGSVDGSHRNSHHRSLSLAGTLLLRPHHRLERSNLRVPCGIRLHRCESRPHSVLTFRHKIRNPFPHRTARCVEQEENLLRTSRSPNALRVVLTLADAPANANRQIEVVITCDEREFLQHLRCCACEIVLTDVVSGVAHAHSIPHPSHTSSTLTKEINLSFLSCGDWPIGYNQDRWICGAVEADKNDKTPVLLFGGSCQRFGRHHLRPTYRSSSTVESRADQSMSASARDTSSGVRPVGKMSLAMAFASQPFRARYRACLYMPSSFEIHRAMFQVA